MYEVYKLTEFQALSLMGKYVVIHPFHKVHNKTNQYQPYFEMKKRKKIRLPNNIYNEILILIYKKLAKYHEIYV